MKIKGLLIILIVMSTALLLTGKTVFLPEVQTPSSITVEGGELIIVDGFTIRIYSAKTFKLKSVFGKNGEGPGEFKYTPTIKVLPECIFANDFGKAIRFSREGKLQKEQRIPNYTTWTPLKKNFLQNKTVMDRGKRVAQANIAIVNENAELINPVYQAEMEVNFYLGPANEKEKFEMICHYFGVDTDGEKVFIADSKKGFVIDVFDTAGSTLYSIDKKMEKIKVTGDYKKEAVARFKLSKNYKLFKKRDFVFKPYFPGMASFMVKDKKIYVAVYKKENKKHEFIILDLSGNILGKVFLPIEYLKSDDTSQDALYTFKDGMFYYLKESETLEEWELLIEKLKK